MLGGGSGRRGGGGSGGGWGEGGRGRGGKREGVEVEKWESGMEGCMYRGGNIRWING